MTESEFCCCGNTESVCCKTCVYCSKKIKINKLNDHHAECIKKQTKTNYTTDFVDDEKEEFDTNKNWFW